MRLIDTRTYEIREISPGLEPNYAILSHTWENDEYVFGDRHDPDRRQSAGFKKISGGCALAASQGYGLLWVDTCCIDKTSSAELTESINSMYRWYEEAKICYVFLSDFSLERALHGTGIRLQSSRWFTRGWTLQELLAPEIVVFYDAVWIEIGSKTFLKDTLSQICRISVQHLSQPKEASVATKMSWASRRETTREEDIAYCLLGLFGVNIPLIYGEGANAFFRLQCEIIRSSPDESLFAWRDRYYTYANVRRVYYSGLLATSPRCFEESGGIVPIRLKNLERPPYFLTNQGLSIEVTLSTAGHQRDCSDDFKNDLLANRDSRMKGRDEDNGRPHIVKTVLACAPEHIQEAPVMLTLGIIDGKLASRINCDSLDLDINAFHVNKRVFSFLQNSRQSCLVGWQRGYRDRYLRPLKDPSHILPFSTHISLTSTFREVFTFNRDASRNHRTAVARKSSVIVRHPSHILPFTTQLSLTSTFREVFAFNRDASRVLRNAVARQSSVVVHHQIYGQPTDTDRLHFWSSSGYGFSLEWDNPECFYQFQYFISFSNIGAATNNSVSLEMMSEHVQERPFRKRIGIGDNLSTAIDGKFFLWISTSRRPDLSQQASVVLDVTPIDRSRALKSSLDND